MRLQWKNIRLVFLAILATSCAQEQGGGFCQDHHQVHTSHADSAGQLQIDIDRDNSIKGMLSLPAAGFDEDMNLDIGTRLARPGQLILIEGGGVCGEIEIDPPDSGATLTTQFTLDCDPAVQIKQVDVMLLESIPEIDEIVVSVSTPATSKRFAISRHCDAPIFRLGGDAR